MIAYLGTVGFSLTVSLLVFVYSSSCSDPSGYFLEFDLISFNSIISYFNRIRIMILEFHQIKFEDFFFYYIKEKKKRKKKRY
jgi:hypothetical protein